MAYLKSNEKRLNTKVKNLQLMVGELKEGLRRCRDEAGMVILAFGRSLAFWDDEVISGVLDAVRYLFRVIWVGFRGLGLVKPSESSYFARILVFYFCDF